MEHMVYTGDGTYSRASLVANYLVYLPLLPVGTYEFFTSKIYNFSCAEYPNTILIFMRVANGPNNDLSGYTDQPGVPITFSLSDLNIINIDTHCTPLNKMANINVIIMHDSYLDTTYAKDHAYCKPPVNGPDAQAAAVGALYQPKRYKYGTVITMP